MIIIGNIIGLLKNVEFRSFSDRKHIRINDKSVVDPIKLKMRSLRNIIS